MWRIRSITTVTILLAAVAVAGLHAVGEQRDLSQRPTRSLPPKSWDSETERIFSQRPAALLKGVRPRIGSPGTLPDDGGPTATDPEPSGGFAWSALISAATVTDEIKAYRLSIAENVVNPGVFKGGGNRKLIKQFGVVATMFGIMAEHDASARWKDIAPGARDAFARAGRNAKAADTNTYKESKLRSDDLDELVRGGSVEFDEAGEPPEWSDVTTRRALMDRLKIAYNERLKPWTASQAEFERHRTAVKHEAEIIAALAEVIQREQFEFYDDDDYLAYCRNMQRHAQATAVAAAENNVAEAQRLLGEISKNCSSCHEGYK